MDPIKKKQKKMNGRTLNQFVKSLKQKIKKNQTQKVIT